ncbi:MAG: hypothetical protein M3Q50_03445 [Chloroflexota bacterium]|nr:hypothetical protein [Chloroflexota bacterium]
MKRRDLLRASTAIPALAAAGLDLESEAAAKPRNKNTNSSKPRDRIKNRTRNRRRRRKNQHTGGQGPKRDVTGMNVIVFITDQQRAIQHFPPDWEKTIFPAPPA